MSMCMSSWQPSILGSFGELPVRPEGIPQNRLAPRSSAGGHFVIEGLGEGWIADRVQPVDRAPLPVGGVEGQGVGVVPFLGDQAGRCEGGDGGMRHGGEATARAWMRERRS